MTNDNLDDSPSGKCRFAMIGGFLGAGKTTLIGQIAKRYVEANKTVGIVTNDQAQDLVDTAHLRSLGFDVGEVAGSCFCCNFDELIATADRLSEIKAPDLLIAEPVGSCTDLVATVVRPMAEILGDRFEVASFGVLLKPSHGQRILANGDQRSGFSPQAEYIFRKQLEEADYLMIGRAETLTPDQIDLIKSQLLRVAPDATVIATSPKTGLGVDEVIAVIESSAVAGARLLDIDYDIYADGEAEMGWVNAAVELDADQAVPLDSAITALVSSIAEKLSRDDDAEVAHLKASLSGNGVHCVANLVASDQEVELGLASNRTVSGPLQLVVNARVIIDPTEMETMINDSIAQWCGRHDLRCGTIQSRSLRPGRPTPTHRVTV